MRKAKAQKNGRAEDNAVGLAKLSEHCSGHSFLKVEFANEIVAHFGLKPLTAEKVKANTSDPKGLKVEGAKPGTVIEGVSGYRLAEYIASGVVIGYQNDLMGRGFRFSHAFNAVHDFLSAGGSH